MSGMERLPFILRDHRDQLRARWLEALAASGASEDYRELMASPVGDRFLRKFVDDLISICEAEQYELPGLGRQLAESATRDAHHRLGLGFALLDLLRGWQVLIAASIDVLQDAIVVGELHSAGEALQELKAFTAVLDRMVRTTVTAAAEPPAEE